VPHVAVIGLGEAGSAIARDLQIAGATVRAWDPAVSAADGLDLARTGREAAEGADAVLSVNAASAAEEVAESVADALGADAVFADLNTGSPALKRAVAEIVETRGGGRFADVALMSPVVGRGLRTPALVSGPGAERFAELLVPLGMPVTQIGPEPGAAAARKLVRSVFTKGLAAAIGEALAAAEALDRRGDVYADIERTLTDADGPFLRRLVEGSARHAPRRAEEMAAAVAMLEELGVEPRIASAAEGWLRSLGGDGG
jgi:3-hydroxyisobutyrate dehydrogenase-like beta-hydroxyacid dehydrogenase